MQQSTIVGLAFGAAIAIGAVVTYCLWDRNEWNADLAANQIVELTDDYNTAIAEQPGDWRKATFLFDLLADKRLKAFAEAHRECAEFTKWQKDFEAQCKSLRKALRTA